MTPDSPEYVPLTEYLLARLRDLKAARQWSDAKIAEDLSKLVGGTVSASRVASWFRAKDPSVPSLEYLVGLAELFNVPTDYLLGLTPAATPEPAPILFDGHPLFRLVRAPRPTEETGVEIARRLCAGGKRADLMRDLRIKTAREFDEHLCRAAYGDLFQVAEGAPENGELAKKLKQKYPALVIQRVAAVGKLNCGLLETVVLGALGASVVREQMKDYPPKVGLAGGFSCARVVISLVQTLGEDPSVHLWPIAVQGAAGNFNALNGNALVGMFGYLTGRTGLTEVSLLEYASNAELQANPGHPTAGHLKHIVENTTIAFLGVSGSVQRSHSRTYGEPGILPRSDSAPKPIPVADLMRRGIIGDVLYNWVTDKGVATDLTPECDRMVCSVGLEGLLRMQDRGIPVVALIAQADAKVEVLKLALRQGWVNGLVVTDAVATQLLE